MDNGQSEFDERKSSHALDRTANASVATNFCSTVHDFEICEDINMQIKTFLMRYWDLFQLKVIMLDYLIWMKFRGSLHVLDLYLLRCN